MKIVILRGGAGIRRPRWSTGPALGAARPGPAPAATTRERGVMAIGDGAGRWVMVNMSPAVAHQLDSDLRLDGHTGLPDADVRAVLLTDAQVDHVGGLLGLRDGAPIDLYATPAVFEELTTAMPVLPVLQHYCGVHWHVVPVAGDRTEASFRIEGMPTLEFTAIATRAPAPPHLGRREPGLVGDSIALAVRDLATGQRAFCAPGLSHFGLPEVEWMREADCLLIDGPGPGRDLTTGAALPTLAAGLAPRAPAHRASAAFSGERADPARLAQADDPVGIDVATRPAEPDGPDHDRAVTDWLSALATLPARHKVLVAPPRGPSGHLDAGTTAQRLADRGFALAYDGMQIEL